ncbi:MAG: hypothetical protein IT373_36435 [Polyangiaceae bacterium]|nr:hypothetical protein [Polyangiaceae bacterium]
MARRTWLTRSLLSLVCVASASGCSSPTTEEVADTSLQLRYEPASADFFATPWPSSARLLADGTVDLTNLPGGGFGFLELVRSAIEGRVHGFSTMPVGFFQMAEDPGDAVLLTPAASHAPGAAVALVALDPDHCGEPVPVEMQISRTPDDQYLPVGVLEIAPVPGFALRQGVDYAFVVKKSFGAPAGRTTARPAAWDADLASAPELEPLRACAAQGGVVLDELALATVFRPQDVLTEARALRDAVADPTYATAPVLTDWASAPSYAGATWDAFTAHYQTPIFQAGTSPYDEGGDIVFGADGRPEIQRWEQVPMLLLAPQGAGPHPLLLFIDGTGWGEWSHVSSSETQALLAAGFAVASYMPQFHGSRATPGSDPETHTYNFLNPIAGRNVLRQQLADTSYFVRVLREAVALEPTAPVLDTTSLVFAGQSQGSQNGAMLAAIEPEIRAFVLNGLASYLSVTILERKDILDYAALLKGLLAIQGPIDRFHPVLSVLQLGADSIDLHNYAGAWRGWEGKPAGAHLFVLNGHNDTTTAPKGMEAITIAGDLAPVAPPGWDVDPFGVWDRDAEPLPISGNRLAFDGGDLTQATHLDADTGHFTIYDKPAERARAVAFLVDALAGVPTLPQ